ncbi:MAG TPA: HAD-IA family hydrolase [Rubrobacter sp.]|nr:HAD-IA family hydrolase [Rubrobacter sp.]
MRYLVWDFDGTLGYRVGRWSSALRSVLEEAVPGHDRAGEALGAQLRGGFPWHTPEVPHPALSSPDLWWDALLPVFVRAFEDGGVEPATSRALAGKVRGAYVDPRHWRLYDDAAPALRGLSSRGWTHLILSNHVPELPDILRALGLEDLILRVFNSAESGYEKPHPRAYEGVLETVAGAEAAWMVGDNPQADVRGAEAVGLPAILVRGQKRGTRRHCEDLSGVSGIIENS